MKYYPSGQLPVTPHMYFIYGDGGTGKTSLFREFPGHKMLFSFDQSTNPIKPDDNIDALVFEQSDGPNIRKLVESATAKAISGGKYQAICFDCVNALHDWVLDNTVASNDGRANYRDMQMWFRKFGTYLRESGMTVYATAHQTDQKDGTGFEPAMNFGAFSGFTASFDFVGRIYKQGGVRTINCDTEQGDHGKNRIDDRLEFPADELLDPSTEEKEGN
ncbi:AAA family ATPase [Lacticaseibacillus jixiensis]|uniref:AAA family ATPase n=1 Tax=Lacticaseibacillus jixiensis TaxID=3231926 RepID=UPI0036F44B65